MLISWIVAILIAAFTLPAMKRAYFRHLVPESRLLGSWLARAGLYRHVRWKLAGRWFLLGDMATVGVLIAAVYLLNSFRMLVLLACCAWQLGSELAAMALFPRRVQLLARKRLVELGFSLCIHCGYDLRAATSDICPECGQSSPRPRFERLEVAAERHKSSRC